MAFWDSLLGASGNNQSAFDQYAQAMREAAGRYQPYVDYGNQGLGRSFSEYDKLLTNPNFVQDMVAGGFYESPYQAELLKRTTDRMNMNAANTGMMGSGVANRALQDELNSMTGQFMNEYIDRGMQSYGLGLGGMQDTAKLGFQGLNEMMPLLEQAAGGQLQGQLSKNNSMSNLLSSLFSLGGSFVGGMTGLGGMGDLGRFAGSKLGISPFQSNPKSSTISLGGGF